MQFAATGRQGPDRLKPGIDPKVDDVELYEQLRALNDLGDRLRDESSEEFGAQHCVRLIEHVGIELRRMFL